MTPQRIESDSVPDILFSLLDDDATVLVELDADARIVRCNAGAADAAGCTVEELTGTPLPTLSIDPSAGQADAPETDSAWMAGYLRGPEEQWLRRDGSRCGVHWLKLWSFTDRDGFLKLGYPERRPGGSLGDDASSRIQLKAFLQAAPDAIITIDDQGRMVSVNPATERLFGYRRSELIGHNVSMLMPSPDRGQHDEYLRHYLETGEAKIIGIGREISALRSDGSTFPARLSVCEFVSRGERFFTGMLHDISERVEAEEQQRTMLAEHAHVSRVVALGEMASSIAHEINQPLAAIVSFADASRKLIETGEDDAKTIDHALQQISGQGQRAGEIIRRLRQFVRKREPNHSSVDVNDLIQAAADMTAHDAERHGISLDLELDHRPLDALVDRLQIEQLILNLMRNSLEAINESGASNGAIEVRSRRNGKEIEVEVVDNGPGINPAEMPKVFEPFYTTKTKGTGLGLSISRSIAEAHGGSLTFKPNEDGGVTFSLALPAEPTEDSQ